MYLYFDNKPNLQYYYTQGYKLVGWPYCNSTRYTLFKAKEI